jgi:hypothetical protein
MVVNEACVCAPHTTTPCHRHTRTHIAFPNAPVANGCCCCSNVTRQRERRDKRGERLTSRRH